MEAVLKTGGKMVELGVVEGSYIYLRGEDGADVFIEWGEAGPELRAEALACREKVEDSIRDASASLRASAASLMTLL